MLCGDGLPDLYSEKFESLTELSGQPGPWIRSCMIYYLLHHPCDTPEIYLSRSHHWQVFYYNKLARKSDDGQLIQHFPEYFRFVHFGSNGCYNI